ncbi:MAG: SDR family oxidoreductase [Ignavibacterium sp.]|nr:SDR family oxidoreductase [Ignavibacterium sp.]MCX7610992.1 SDR family oxidoreductase [Ignavibacterium sp.]MDW8374256.1 SDR family oxidoreductase [Ignavibacteriales bacterium]
MNKKLGIWITGASSGIGKALSIEFAKIGFKVFASSRNNVDLERINQELEKDKCEVEIIPCNVASFSNVDNSFKKILAKTKLGCLVNNAGITTFKLAEENSIREIDDIISTNLLGSIYTIKTVLPHFIQNGGGTIINVLSVVAKQVYTKSSAYSASKAGLLAYTNSLREEVRKYNIRVINVLPGATETQMWPKKIREEFSSKMMSASDVARAIVWAYLQEGNSVVEELVIKPITGDLK